MIQTHAFRHLSFILVFRQTGKTENKTEQQKQKQSYLSVISLAIKKNYI